MATQARREQPPRQAGERRGYGVWLVTGAVTAIHLAAYPWSCRGMYQIPRCVLFPG